MAPDPRAAPEFLALQRAVAGRYSLVRELGRGGMGIVILARDLALDRLVAIKLLPHGTEESRARFLAEARTAAALSHPNIVPIHAVESHDGLTFFVMGYVAGETLGARVRRAGPLPATEAMRAVQEVAWALAHAHAHGVVHRDVKPENVLLDAATGRALVTDFGIARHAGRDAETPAEGVVRGTPAFVAPEVAMGARGDAASDLYSLGITAWVAAAGRTPFTADTAAAMLLAHASAPVPGLATAARVPARFARAIDRCLAKSPADRWPDADALAAELDAAQARGPQPPAPVRAFLREYERADAEIGAMSTAAGVALAEAAALPLFDLLTRGSVSFDSSVLSWIFVVIGALAVGLSKARVLQLAAPARGLLQAGVGLPRVIAAQRFDDATRLEERLAERAADRVRDRAVRWTIAGAAVGAMGALGLAFSDLGGWINALGAAGSVVLPTLAIRLARGLRDSRTGTTSAARSLQGLPGRALFRLAGIGIGARPATAPLEDPLPTAVAVGEAARDLLRALPADARQALGPGVEDLITRLEAMAVRRSATGGADPAVTDALTGLENVRIELLRLSMGALPADALTAELARVRELGAAVERRVSADADVAALLDGPGRP